MKDHKVDLCVIGAGSAGLSAAAGAVQLGLSVVLFEHREMGGDCLNWGCVPSKALIAAADAAHGAHTSGRFGVSASPSVDWSAVKAHVQAAIAHIAPIDSQERFEGLGVAVIRERARFINPRTVQSQSARVRARRFVIATGSHPAIPPIPGLADAPYHTNETIFTIDALPVHLLILGGGAIGVELGQAFRRLGAKVTIVEAMRLLDGADEEAVNIVRAQINADGVVVREGAKVAAVARAGEGVSLTLEYGETIGGSHLLIAAGRTPALEGLGLEAAGVAFTKKGVATKANLRAVGNPRVWALGDAAGRELLTHAAGWHASVFVRNALFKAASRADSQPIPAAVYSDPELAQIGLTETQAAQKHGERAITVVRWPFHENDRAVA
ncbi:MAG: dihydrolipoamide dehydrogenase, partial [Alphaproteobacteria bacterium]|nr:dihydrolipoamide dehydrogenase [Alphaproteobacteria bacterium]